MSDSRAKTALPSREDILAFIAREREGGNLGTIGKREIAREFGIRGADKIDLQPKDVVLYGFGRIGRIAARELISQAGKGQQLRLRAIVTRDKSPDDIIKRADLLRSDSVHGHFQGTVIPDVEQRCLWVNGHRIDMISAGAPEDIDYTAYGIENALLIDNTGVWRDRANLSRHLQSKGVSKVLLTAPGKGDIPNIVYGVNNNRFDTATESVWSAASCTTNAIVPVLSAIHAALGIEEVTLLAAPDMVQRRWSVPLAPTGEAPPAAT